ncbi:hypothetical protein AVEN_75493-1 [Araneus ventricosus]|uniref:Integrase zinc-binding domain-containing protein n=1 Tax=Araneus ventricosus TaxID=182803 RepID=A0A4Y2DPU7_ARAVE|nr:hypothetical protein AVEN_75493-1 [Araneus ventricosus]
MSVAENYWIKRSQENEFLEEIEAIKCKREISRVSKIFLFKPFLDREELLRVGGSLQFFNLSYEKKHPALLPTRDNFTELVVWKCHERTGHAGLSETISKLRDRFFVLKGRQRVKSLISKCYLCKRFRTKPATQDMAYLPPDRIRETFSFAVIGLDYLVPLCYVEKSESRKSSILPFTCAVTRAVHLELSTDMSAPSFIRSFKKFVSRRGLFKTVYSDNARAFLKMKKECNVLDQTLNSEDVGIISLKNEELGKQMPHWGRGGLDFGRDLFAR